jgi:hypothetical protein
MVIFVLLEIIQPINILSINNYTTGESMYFKKIDDGFSFTTKITHSVHLTPVYEKFIVKSNGDIYLDSTSIQDLGWGVPSTFDNEMTIENNMINILNINEKIDFLPFRVSDINNSKLIFNDDREIDLNTYVKNYERIDISVVRLPCIIYIIRGEKDDF